MKAVILAGGRGTRLLPLTANTNKHLLPVAGRPMVAHGLRRLAEAGVHDTLIVTNPDDIPAFRAALGGAEAHGLTSVDYVAQPEVGGGVADALRAAEGFADGSAFVVMLGDNLLVDSLRPFVEAFTAQIDRPRLLLGRVKPPMRLQDLGVAEFDPQDASALKRIVEKPVEPPSELAVLGVYAYPAGVFPLLAQLEPGPRGELEITDFNNTLIGHGPVAHTVYEGRWIDAGTHETLALAETIFGTQV